MTTVDRKHPTYRDLLAALQKFNDQELDMPIKISDKENRESHAILFEGLFMPEDIKDF